MRPTRSNCWLAATVLLGISAPATDAAMPVNTGHSGLWFEPETSGQGFSIDVLPGRDRLFVSWLTYSPLDEQRSTQRWFTAQGDIGEDGVARLVVSRSEGGRFDTAGGVTTARAGEMELSFSSCRSATLVYALDDGRQGEVSLQRLNDAGLCERVSGQALFPNFARLTASAENLNDDGTLVRCDLAYLVEVEAASFSAVSRVFHGSAGGEARREIRPDEGDAIAFTADAFSPVTISLDGSSVTIAAQIPQPESQPLPEDSRFWRQVEQFSGSLHADGSAEGYWVCAPLDTRGDDRYFATGEWRLDPITEKKTGARQ